MLYYLHWSEVPRPAPPGPGGLDLSAVLGARNKLKSVGTPLEKQASTEEKLYDDQTGVQSAFAKFRMKGWLTPFACSIVIVLFELCDCF